MFLFLFFFNLASLAENIPKISSSILRYILYVGLILSQKARYFNTIFILKHNKNFKSFFGMIINQKTTLLPRGDCKLPCFNHLKRHTSKIVPKTAGALRCVVPADQNMAAYNRSLTFALHLYKN